MDVPVTGTVVVLVVLGLLLAAFPGVLWSLSRWQYRHPEAVHPSDSAFLVVRFAGAALAGVGLFLVLAHLNRDVAENERAAHQSEVARDPEAAVRRFGAAVLRKARASGTPPRRLEPSELREVARRVGDVTAEPITGFESSGAVTVGVDIGQVFYQRPYCLMLPATADGQLSITSGSCRLPIEVQRTQVEGLAVRAMQTARAQGISPRDRTVLREVDRPPELGRIVVQRSEGLEVMFDPDYPHGVNRDFWCVVLPEQVGGPPEIRQSPCPRSEPASTSTIPG